MRAVILLVLLSALCSCGGKESGKLKKFKNRVAYFSPSTFLHLSGWENDEHLTALHSFRNSCKALLKIPSTQSISNASSLGGQAYHWHKPCLDAEKGYIFSNHDAKEFFEKWFIPYIVRDSDGSEIGRFSGYYNITLNARLYKTDRFRYPIYRRPQNLNILKGKRDFTHSAINRGVLKNKNLEIAYVDDPGRLYFMHIQGSGTLVLQDNNEINLSFDGHNGHRYVEIGPMFKNYAREKIRSPVDMMRWLTKYPNKGFQLMEKNPSYVFFRSIDGKHKKGGSLSKLTAERSIAVDHKIFPYGVPLWVETHTPKIPKKPRKSYNKLMIAQDTGSEINGAIRGDIFFGRGYDAEEKASFMNNKGKYYVLMPKSLKVPRRYSGD